MPVIPILLYHSVTSDPDDWIAPYTVTPRDFAHHVELILESGRTAMTVSELHDGLQGRAPLPDRPVVITFDDGFADFAEVSDVLAAHDLPSTLYITTGALVGRASRPADMALPPAPMLDWSQLAELVERNVEIGGHTHTHPQLDTLRTSVATDEIRRCKHLLEDELGQAVQSFAYPHGFHSARVVRAVEGAGYRSACAVMDALSSEADRAFALARLTVRSSTTAEQIAAWLDGRDARVAPYPERLRTKGWRAYRRIRGARSTRGVFAGTTSAEGSYL
ncbi:MULTISPECIES: polysaccharide deacetylase family protein [unclassified Mycolicibacterium]|uniref:polysaccharide deacetylase family protein n=1 Tax=unclassified Mycolicibacterium TaxID=2636767 RepID=UPI002ED7BCBA